LKTYILSENKTEDNNTQETAENKSIIELRTELITEAKEATQQHNKKRKQKNANSTKKRESHNRHTEKLEEGIPNPNGKKTRVLIVGDSQLRRVDEKNFPMTAVMSKLIANLE